MRPLPFPVKAWFDCFVQLIYAVDKEKAEAHLFASVINATP